MEIKTFDGKRNILEIHYSAADVVSYASDTTNFRCKNFSLSIIMSFFERDGMHLIIFQAARTALFRLENTTVILLQQYSLKLVIVMCRTINESPEKKLN